MVQYLEVPKEDESLRQDEAKNKQQAIFNVAKAIRGETKDMQETL